MNKLIKSQSVWVVVGLVVVVIVVVFIFKVGSTNPPPELTPLPTLLLSPSPISSVEPKPKQSGGLQVETYDNLVLVYDGRRLALAADCRSSEPSNVDYRNGTKVMLDNTASREPRVIKIGSNSYNVIARGWTFITFTSKTLPANLPMFCGDMELGQIGIIR